MKLKRLMMLALCLALVYAMSVTVFADDSYSKIKEYEGGDTHIEAFSEITRYATHGVVEAESIIAEAGTKVTVVGHYEDYYREEQVFSDSHQATTISYLYLSFPAIDSYYNGNEIFALVDATYYFWAEAPTYDVWEVFEFTDTLYY